MMHNDNLDAIAGEAVSDGMRARAEVLSWVGRRYPEMRQADRASVVSRVFQIAGNGARQNGAETRSLKEDMVVEAKPAMLPDPPAGRQLDWGATWGTSPAWLQEALQAAIRELLERDPDASAPLAATRARERWAWPFDDRVFFVGPWRRVKTNGRRKTKPAPSAPNIEPKPAQESKRVAGRVLLEGDAGQFTSDPAPGGQWDVTLTVRCDRSVAINLQGQAFAILFPDAAR